MEPFASNKKKRRFSVNDLSNPVFQEPFKYGWVRELVYRQRTVCKTLYKMADVYYYTPCGSQLRSKLEVTKYLPKTGELEIDNFSFIQKPIPLVDPTKQVIRHAKPRNSLCKASRKVESPVNKITSCDAKTSTSKIISTNPDYTTKSSKMPPAVKVPKTGEQEIDNFSFIQKPIPLDDPTKQVIRHAKPSNSLCKASRKVESPVNKITSCDAKTSTSKIISTNPDYTTKSSKMPPAVKVPKTGEQEIDNFSFIQKPIPLDDPTKQVIRHAKPSNSLCKASRKVESPVNKITSCDAKTSTSKIISTNPDYTTKSSKMPPAVKVPKTGEQEIDNFSFIQKPIPLDDPTKQVIRHAKPSNSLCKASRKVESPVNKITSCDAKTSTSKIISTNPDYTTKSSKMPPAVKVPKTGEQEIDNFSFIQKPIPLDDPTKQVIRHAKPSNSLCKASRKVESPVNKITSCDAKTSTSKIISTNPDYTTKSSKMPPAVKVPKTGEQEIDNFSFIQKPIPLDDPTKQVIRHAKPSNSLCKASRKVESPVNKITSCDAKTSTSKIISTNPDYTTKSSKMPPAVKVPKTGEQEIDNFSFIQKPIPLDDPTKQVIRHAKPSNSLCKASRKVESPVNKITSCDAKTSTSKIISTNPDYTTKSSKMPPAVKVPKTGEQEIDNFSFIQKPIPLDDPTKQVIRHAKPSNSLCKASRKVESPVNKITSCDAKTSTSKRISTNPDYTTKSSKMPPAVKDMEPFASNKKKRRFSVNDLSNPVFQEPFKYGWVRELVYRQRTVCKTLYKMADVYYYTPCGRQLRSKLEVTKYLPKTGELKIDNFSFIQKPIPLDDPTKQVIRHAKPRNSLCKASRKVESPVNKITSCDAKTSTSKRISTNTTKSSKMPPAVKADTQKNLNDKFSLPPRRKRGRPQKRKNRTSAVYMTNHKSRKSHEDAKTDSTNDSTYPALSPARKRGRPSGSKNRSPAHTESRESRKLLGNAKTDSANDSTYPALSPARKRGRPSGSKNRSPAHTESRESRKLLGNAKTDSANDSTYPALSPARKRGRPSGSKNRSPAHTESRESRKLLGNAKTDSANDSTYPALSPARKRGRPSGSKNRSPAHTESRESRKLLGNAKTDSANDSTYPALSPARKRGRPSGSKNRSPAHTESRESRKLLGNAEPDSSTDSKFPTLSPPRNRGRPSGSNDRSPAHIESRESRELLENAEPDSSTDCTFPTLSPPRNRGRPSGSNDRSPVHIESQESRGLLENVHFPHELIGNAASLSKTRLGVGKSGGNISSSVGNQWGGGTGGYQGGQQGRQQWSAGGGGQPSVWQVPQQNHQWGTGVGYQQPQPQQQQQQQWKGYNQRGYNQHGSGGGGYGSNTAANQQSYNQQGYGTGSGGGGGNWQQHGNYGGASGTGGNGQEQPWGQWSAGGDGRPSVWQVPQQNHQWGTGGGYQQPQPQQQQQQQWKGYNQRGYSQHGSGVGGYGSNTAVNQQSYNQQGYDTGSGGGGGNWQQHGNYGGASGTGGNVQEQPWDQQNWQN